MATPAEEATRDRITLIAAAMAGNTEIMKLVRLTAKKKSIPASEELVAEAKDFVDAIEAAHP